MASEDGKVINSQGWVIVEGVHCCYCQLAEWACPKHGEATWSKWDVKGSLGPLMPTERRIEKEDNNDG
jgi:hypothetical protein